MEDVACTGGIDNGDAIGGSVEELFTVPGENAFLTERCGGESTGVTALHLAKSLLEVGLGHQARGEVAANDEIVDVGEKILDVGIELIEVGDDGDVGFASPGGGQDGGLGVEAVYVQGAGVGDPFALKVRGVKGESFVAAGEDCALTRGVDEDEGLLADAAGSGDEMGFDTGASEGFAMEGSCCIITDFADVASGHTPVLAGYDCSGHLSAGENCGGRVFDLGAACGIGGEGDDRVCCV
jgi:hypothetical protein